MKGAMQVRLRSMDSENKYQLPIDTSLSVWQYSECMVTTDKANGVIPAKPVVPVYVPVIPNAVDSAWLNRMNR